MENASGWNKGGHVMIRDDMSFVNFSDFYKRRHIIRAIFIKLSSRDQAIYKYYVYSRRLLKEKVCDMIWEYLNVLDDEEYNTYSNKLDLEYQRYI